jgi:hypothetical protein
VLTALATRFGGSLAILRKISRVVLRTATAMTVLATFAASLCRPLAVLGKIARAALPTNMTGAGRLLPVFGKIARITGMMLFRHRIPPSSITGRARRSWNDRAAAWLSSRFL